MNINLAERNCMGPFVYNDKLLEYIKANGKPITEVPEERDSNEQKVSPLIALCHVPSGKVNAYKSWFWFSNGRPLVHTEGGCIESNNDDFMYVMYSDDPRLAKEEGRNQVIIYDEKINNGIGTFLNFKDEETKQEFLKDRKKFDSSYTKKELKSKWYKKFIKLNMTKKSK